MTKHIALAFVLAFTSAAWAQQPADVAGQLAVKADEALARSTQELARLRDQIAAEKVPLAEQLTQLETQLARLRAEQAAAARVVDEANLATGRLKTENKFREDELAYVGNLLDEYARNYEPKIHVCELQYLGEKLEEARQAPGNNALSRDQKFNRQVDFARASLKRLFDVVGGGRFDGVGVDLQSTVVQGQFAIIGPVALFRSKDGAQAGLVVPQQGSTRPLIRPLENEVQAGLATLVASGEGTLPLDPSRGAALKALVQKTNLIHIFKKGGPIMWPLLVASMLALGTVLERLLFLLLERARRNRKELSRFYKAVNEGRLVEAVTQGEKSKYYVVRSLAYALHHREDSLASALLYAQNRELKRFRRGLPILDTVITLAPLLGLLGTVTGMMGSFSLIGGELSAPGAITGGIAEALIATAFGLGIAITSLVPFNALNNKVEEARHEMEAAGTQLELMVPQTARKPRKPVQLEETLAAPAVVSAGKD
jgi:biopolymer transport protein ExbB